MNQREKKRLLWDIFIITVAIVAVGYAYITHVLSREAIDRALAMVTPDSLRSELLDGALLARLEDRLSVKDVLHHDTAARRALDRAANAERITWRNPQSGHSGAIIPLRIYRDDEQRYCREYIQSITIGDNTYDAINTACRETDNTWKMVENLDDSV